MTSYTRTQVYLDPDDHRQLRLLAARRGDSMTELVREAVARYVVDELDALAPSKVDLGDAVAADPRYEGLPPGRDGLVHRMRVRASASPDDDLSTGEDRDVGDALATQQETDRAAWLRRDRS